jgi:hypothetical protein
MEKKQVLSLVAVSFLLCNIIAFLDEGIQSFNYLTHLGDWIALVLYTLIFLILPLIIFYRSIKRANRFYLALLGFILPLGIIVLSL